MKVCVSLCGCDTIKIWLGGKDNGRRVGRWGGVRVRVLEEQRLQALITHLLPVRWRHGGEGVMEEGHVRHHRLLIWLLHTDV